MNSRKPQLDDCVVIIIENSNAKNYLGWVHIVTVVTGRLLIAADLQISCVIIWGVHSTRKEGDFDTGLRTFSVNLALLDISLNLLAC